MYILGISCFYHESAAALILDGKIIAAAAEERFTRKKHDPSFPIHAIEFCLQKAGITSNQIGYVVFYEKPFRKFERILQFSLTYYPKTYAFFVESMQNFLSKKLWIKSLIAKHIDIAMDRILFVPHHLSHAAAAFYPSPFEKAAILTLDGVGEWTTGSFGIGYKGKISLQKELQLPNSVGLLYATFTAFLGFEVNDGEYKVMGMAGFAKPLYIEKVKKTYKQFIDGSINLNLDYFAFYRDTKKMYTKKFMKEFADCERFALAASIQACTEEVILSMVNYIYAKTKQKNLVFGGGVGLNSLVNIKIIQKSKFKNIFVFPASGDDGGAVGAALFVYHQILKNTKRIVLKDVFLGPEYSSSYIENFLDKENIFYNKMKTQELVEFIGTMLTQGKVIGWFEGRAEFGPRALGHRSILADPRKKEMKDIVNKKIKYRESFRPFAPSVLSEFTSSFFIDAYKNLSLYMLGAFQVREKTNKQAPAIVHVDGSSRIQEVFEDYPGAYLMLLKSFFKKTELPILLNTSFNLSGEPIVNSPEDAYDTFVRSDIDILVLEQYVISKDTYVSGDKT